MQIFLFCQNVLSYFYQRFWESIYDYAWNEFIYCVNDRLRDIVFTWIVDTTWGSAGDSIIIRSSKMPSVATTAIAATTKIVIIRNKNTSRSDNNTNTIQQRKNNTSRSDYNTNTIQQRKNNTSRSDNNTNTIQQRENNSLYNNKCTNY